MRDTLNIIVVCETLLIVVRMTSHLIFINIMKKNTFSRIILTFCLLVVSGISVHAYTERNLLQKAAGSEEQLKEILVMNQAWVPYPAYNDRSAWDALLGADKETLIRAGEKHLDYGVEGNPCYGLSGV